MRNYTKISATDAHFCNLWVSLNPKSLQKPVMDKSRQAKHIPLRAHINWRNPWDMTTAEIKQETPAQEMQKAGVPQRATSAILAHETRQPRASGRRCPMQREPAKGKNSPK